MDLCTLATISHLNVFKYLYIIAAGKFACYNVTWLSSKIYQQLASCRSLELEEAYRLGKENIKDIIACGFDPEKTFIFSDFDFMGGEFYRNIIRLQRSAVFQMTLVCHMHTGTEWPLQNAICLDSFGLCVA